MNNKKILAQDIMVDTVVTLRADASLEDAWNTLFSNRISGAPVVDREGNLLGVISQTDLVREAFADEFSDFPKNSFYLGMPFYDEGDWGRFSDKLSTLSVEEVMTPDPITASVDDEVSYLATQMRQNHIHRLIVTDDRKVVGIISSLDLLKLLEAQ